MVNSDVQKISKYALGIDTATQVKEPTLVYDVSPNSQLDCDCIDADLDSGTSATIITTPTNQVFRIYGVHFQGFADALAVHNKAYVSIIKNNKEKLIAVIRKKTLTANGSNQFIQLRNPIIPDKDTAISIKVNDGTANYFYSAIIYYSISER